tara:strand:+ start:2574 stop:3392 length:819 start_codon:yes stop_codon:yes gene_type:complete
VQRESSSERTLNAASTQTRTRLITIPMSHYCEKARWGLFHAGRDYREEAHLQGFHYLATGMRGWGRRVPVLVEGGEVITDSSLILAHLDKRLPDARKLYPAALNVEIKALEENFSTELGVESRRWVYFHWLNEDTRSLLKVAGQGVPYWQRAIAPVMFPLMRAFLSSLLEPTADKVERGLGTIQRAFDNVEARLRDGRPYLLGDRFTAADLTFACMAAPVLLPREYGIHLPTLEEAPEACRADVRSFSLHPAGQFALQLFRARGSMNSGQST